MASGFPMLSKPYSEREWKEEVDNLKFYMSYATNNLLRDGKQYSFKELNEMIADRDN